MAVGRLQRSGLRAYRRLVCPNGLFLEQMRFFYWMDRVSLSGLKHYTVVRFPMITRQVIVKWLWCSQKKQYLLLMQDNLGCALPVSLHLNQTPTPTTHILRKSDENKGRKFMIAGFWVLFEWRTVVARREVFVFSTDHRPYDCQLKE